MACTSTTSVARRGCRTLRATSATLRAAARQGCGMDLQAGRPTKGHTSPTPARSQQSRPLHRPRPMALSKVVMARPRTSSLRRPQVGKARADSYCYITVFPLATADISST